jgi:acetyl esterase/lipase
MDLNRPAIPEALRQLMAEIGPQWSPALHVKLMLDRFTELHASGRKDPVRIVGDIAYGDHPRQQLDVYCPVDGAATGAAVVFVHGGAFLDGHRNRTPEIYANVLRYFARNGVVGLNTGYRLADEAQYPGATDDVASAIAWAQQNAEKFGIDRKRIFLMGHSAGAAHTASYAYDARRRPMERTGLAGHLVVSGRVRADVLAENPNARKVAAYYGTNDSDLLADRSPVTYITADSIPTFVAFAEYENPLIDVHCAELVWRLAQAKRRSPPFLWLRGHNHTSAIAHINTAEDALGRAMLDFIADPR